MNIMNINNEIGIPIQILEEFKKLGELSVKKYFSNDDPNYSPYIRGYMNSCIEIYKNNNGIEPIPFAVSLSTVDMIVWCFEDGMECPLILFGRKPGQSRWQFPGGFRDPKETSIKAAKRELMEETCLDININKFSFIKEAFIDDKRYRNSPHKVTTSIYSIRLSKDELFTLKAGDDLGEVKLFSLKELKKDGNIIRKIHIQLFDIFYDTIAHRF